MIGSSAAWLPALPPFLVASTVCIAAVPGSIWLARRSRAVAEPDLDRHLHPQPTPRLGGIAMFAGFAVALALFGSAIAYRWQTVAVCGAITLAMALDDVFDLTWRSKFVIEIGAGVLVALTGILITFIAVPGIHSTTVWQLGLLAAPVTIAWIVGMQVSVNFLDGADGVAAGVVAIVAGISLLAAINRVQAPGDVHGAVIEQVQPGSPADNAGLQPGDIILEVNRHKVQNASDVKEQLSSVPKGQDALLLVLWNSGAMIGDANLHGRTIFIADGRSENTDPAILFSAVL